MARTAVALLALCIVLSAILLDFSCIAGAPVQAQAPAYMVKDINTTPVLSSSSPGPAIALGDVTLFSAVSGVGYERKLWRTDGTPEGTALLHAHIASSPELNQLVRLGDVVLFVAYDEHGGELWKTDGTPGGTVLVKDINPGWRSAFPGGLFVLAAHHPTLLGNHVFFLADDGVHGRELWKTDGTTDGTMLVKDINPGPAPGLWLDPYDPNFPYLTPVGNALFFVADDDGVPGRELWRSDGTEEGTALVTDLQFDSNAYIYGLVAADGVLFFSAGGSSYELWRSDGTGAGTSRVTFAANTFAYPALVTPFDGGVLFLANAQPAGTGIQVWRSDGTQPGTEQLTNFGALSSFPAELVAMQDAAFFCVGQYQDSVLRYELWRTDGTALGTSLVRAFLGPISQLTVAGDTLFFSADDGETGTELWVSDGTTERTVRVRDISPGASGSEPSSFFVANGEVFFAADDGRSGRELWRSDGTEIGTRALGDLNPGPLDSAPSFLTYTDGVLLFAAQRSDSGRELWRSDGTEEGTKLFRNLASDAATEGSYPYFLADFDGTLLFAADGGEGANGLWRSDGTEAGTSFVADVSSNGSATRAANRVFFVGYDQQRGLELWVTDGTTGGTRLVRDIRRGPDGSMSYERLVAVGDDIYFAADGGVAGSELWKSDGTEAGTRLVLDVNPRSASGLVMGTENVADVRGAVLFAADDGQSGLELWRSDGTAVGTERVLDVVPGPAGSSLSFLSATDDLLFFVAGDGSSPLELWVTDGTAAGTRRIIDVTRGQPLSGIGASFVLGNTLFFSAETSDLGAELWKTDGTDAGTTLVKDINPGTDGSMPGQFIRAGALLYFTAFESSTRYQLWKSDGTELGTQRVTNVPHATYFRGRPVVPFFADGERLLFGHCINCGFVRGVRASATTESKAEHEAVVDGGRGDGDFTRYVQLWETDGTERGTRRVSDAFLGSLGAGALFRSGRFAYFHNPSVPQTPGVADPGVELWALPLESLGRCGNGALDAGEECDTAGESAECDVDCTAPACGDRVLNSAAGEECDDGNIDDEDCCTSACRANAAGIPCSDFNLCTGADVCDGSGQCVAGPVVDCSDGEALGLCSASRGCVLPPSTATATPTITPTVTVTATPSPTPPLCTGDCDASGRVAVNELVTLVNIALDKAQLSACPSGVPIGVRVDIALLVQAVNAALRGCDQ